MVILVVNSSTLYQERKLISNYLNDARRYLDKDSFSQADNYYKQAVSKAEEVYHFTNSSSDLEFLLALYEQIGKFYNHVYAATNSTNDLAPAASYYEKILYFREHDLQNCENINSLRQALEAYIQLIWLSYELRDKFLFNKYIKQTRKYAKALVRKTKKYDDEQYIILANIYAGHFNNLFNQVSKAYYFYYLAYRRLYKIYKSMPNEGISNDLVNIYNCLISITYKLGFKKQNKNWQKKLKVLEGTIKK